MQQQQMQRKRKTTSAPASPQPHSWVRFRLPWWRRALLRALNVRVYRRPETLATLSMPGPVLVLGNHQSFLDGIVVALASPMPLIFAVDVAFARDNRWTRALFGWMSRRGLGTVVPVARGQPAGLRSLLHALHAGAAVMVFPEGRISRNGMALPERPGAQWLARKSGARVVRIEIRGAHRSRIFGKEGCQWRPRIDLLL